jgi:hypothetical protein
MFHGSIPWELSQLSHLQLLDLAENDLTGSTRVHTSKSEQLYLHRHVKKLYLHTQDLSVGDYTFIYNVSHLLDDQMDIVWKGKDYTF